MIKPSIARQAISIMLAISVRSSNKSISDSHHFKYYKSKLYKIHIRNCTKVLDKDLSQWHQNGNSYWYLATCSMYGTYKQLFNFLFISSIIHMDRRTGDLDRCPDQEYINFLGPKYILAIYSDFSFSMGSTSWWRKTIRTDRRMNTDALFKGCAHS